MIKNIHIETGAALIESGESSGIIEFARSYETPPAVMITPVRSNSNVAIPNIYLSSVSATQVTVASSQPLSGDLAINYIAIKASSKTL